MSARREAKDKGWGEVSEWRKNSGRWTGPSGQSCQRCEKEGKGRTLCRDNFAAQLRVAPELRGSELDTDELAS